MPPGQPGNMDFFGFNRSDWTLTLSLANMFGGVG